MPQLRRVTLRCLCEDLTDDWRDVAEQRAFHRLREQISSGAPDGMVALSMDGVPTTALAAHPLVGSFFAYFASSDPGLKRESISGLADPHWWKQKVARWRGAATDSVLAGEDEAWLCAGGIRASGDTRDFYARFMKAIQNSGAEGFLPRSEDRRLQQVEQKIARRDAWIEQLQLSVLVCLAEADESHELRELHVPAPSPAPVATPVAHLTFELVRVNSDSDELVELLLCISDQDSARPHLVQLMSETVSLVVAGLGLAGRVGAGRLFLV